MELKEYVELRCDNALKAIRYSKSARQITELTDYEKAIIYDYTDDGYLVNETLRETKGHKTTLFSIHLNAVLDKLPSLKDGDAVVYRGVSNSSSVLNYYKNALEKNLILIEHGFMSASQSRRVAYQFGQSLLIIFSKNGKSIQNISKFGVESSFNEQEVLFKSGFQFTVLDIDKENNNNIIILQEL
jgi:hypothetical protein